MIAGLLFANHSIDGTGLAATQPFAGGTLIEQQARALARLGATQIMVIAGRPTPTLAGAIERVGRSLTIDCVPTIAAAAAQVHPLADVVMVADGVVASDALLTAMNEEDREIVAVCPDVAGNGVERIGGGLCWAGAARMAAVRLTEAASLPADYDPQSALLRLAAQAGASTVDVPASASVMIADGDAAQHQANMLALAGLATREGWFVRYVVRPTARLAMRLAARRSIPTFAVAAAIGAPAVLGVVAIAGHWPILGLLLALLATIVSPIGAALLAFRGDARAAAADVAGWAVPGAAILALGLTHAVLPLALALIGFAALGLRAGATDRQWSGSPGAYLLIVTLVTLLGAPLAALAAAGVYAFATIAARIERMRQRA